MPLRMIVIVVLFNRMCPVLDVIGYLVFIYIVFYPKKKRYQYIMLKKKKKQKQNKSNSDLVWLKLKEDCKVTTFLQ